MVIGVHTPEFGFEHDLDNVRREVKELRVDYPVAIDNDYAIWNAFGNHYWPALYFVDAQGQIRHHHFGEGEYEQSEKVIQQLLAEAGTERHDQDLASVDAGGVEAAADWASLRSPENYLGYERTQNFASPDGAAWTRRTPTPSRRGWDSISGPLAGDWTVKRQAIVLNQAEGRITLPLPRPGPASGHGPDGARDSVRFRVLLDGQPPGAAHGIDVDDQGNGTVAEQRLYQLVRQPGPVSDRTFEITFLDPGVQAYAFTFG